MAYPISNVSRRVQYTGSAGVGPYSFSFEILSNTDISVYKNQTLLTLTTDYTVTINANGTGSVTLVSAATAADDVTIYGSRAIERTSDFVTGGDLFANTLNDELDSLVIFTQQNKEEIDRSLQAPVTDPTTINMTLPGAALRAGKLLAFNATTGNAEAGPDISNFTGIYQGSLASAPATRFDTTALQAGDLYFDTTSDSMRVYTGGAWQEIAPEMAIGHQAYTATAGQSSFSVTDGYNVNSVYVYKNGLLLSASAYTATNGTSIVLASAAALNDVIRVVTYFNPVDTISIRNAAAASASAAATSASNASTSATNAASSASAASTSASNASTYAGVAQAFAGASQTSSVNAATSATAAAASAAAAAASFDAFDDIYLGAKSSDPSVDNDGNALTTGDQYFNTVANELRIWNGSAWQAAAVVGGTVNTIAVNTSATLNYGTANGVAYLNGSKVLTTGSALAYDGTTLKVQNNNVVTPVFQIQSYASVGTAIANITYDQGTDIYKFSNPSTFAGSGIDFGTGASSTTRYHIDTGGTSIWSVSGSESMRLNSTGLGIGTSSPAFKLDVSVTDTTAYSTSGYTYEPVRITNNGAGGVSGILFQAISTGTANTAQATISAIAESASSKNTAITFGTRENAGGTLPERMRLDSSGNLGLGVTPSAWSQGKAFELNQAGYGVWNGTSSAYLLANTYFNGGFKYASTGVQASHYYQYQGAHVWSTAPSGTAGNAISFTQAMTLDASGNLGIGTSSPAAKLVSAGSSATNFKALILRNGDGTTGSSASIDFEASTGTSGDEAAMAGRIAGLRTGSGTSGALTFSTTNAGVLAERARIDSSGNLLVGTTSTLGKVTSVIGSAINNCFYARFSAASGDGIGLYSDFTGTTGTAYHGYFRYNGTAVGSITSNSTTTTYATSSDYRLKENQQPLTGSGAFIDALKPKTWNWKVDGSKGVGFIAHEVQEVSPASVVGEKDGEQMQAMEYGSAEFIANIVAELQSLRKRLADAGIA